MIFILRIVAHKSRPEIIDTQSPELSVSYFKLVIALKVPTVLIRIETIVIMRKAK